MGGRDVTDRAGEIGERHSRARVGTDRITGAFGDRPSGRMCLEAPGVGTMAGPTAGDEHRVAQLACGTHRSLEQAPICDDGAADPRTDEERHEVCRTGSGPVLPFSDRRCPHIVGHNDWEVGCGRERISESDVLPTEIGCVAHDSGGAVHLPGHPDSKSRRAVNRVAEAIAHTRHDVCDHGIRAVSSISRSLVRSEDPPVGVDECGEDLGAPEVDAECRVAR